MPTIKIKYPPDILDLVKIHAQVLFPAHRKDLMDEYYYAYFRKFFLEGDEEQIYLFLENSNRKLLAKLMPFITKARRLEEVLGKASLRRDGLLAGELLVLMLKQEAHHGGFNKEIATYIVEELQQNTVNESKKRQASKRSPINEIWKHYRASAHFCAAAYLCTNGKIIEMEDWIENPKKLPNFLAYADFILNKTKGLVNRYSKKPLLPTTNELWLLDSSYPKEMLEINWQGSTPFPPIPDYDACSKEYTRHKKALKKSAHLIH